jgi:DNA polymerase V
MAFPSPAADYKEEVIDLSKELVQHPTATFYFRVKGDSMNGANIPDGALLVVDRSLRPVSGHIVVGVLDGEFTVRRIVRTPRAFVLHPENPAYKPLVLTSEMTWQVWGVVTASIVQSFKGPNR